MSIDGKEEEGVKRALLPSHLLYANHWFDTYIFFLLPFAGSMKYIK
jgi:hypothetical protein